MLHGETVHSPLPQDIPWWSPDFAIFFGVLYLVLFVIASGVGYVLVRAAKEQFVIRSGAAGTHGGHGPAETSASSPPAFK